MMASMRNIVVVAYDSGWVRKYEMEAAQIAAALGDNLIEIHHVGSTSVPGLAAKPVIDIMPVVRDLARLDAESDKMVALGYNPRGENGIPGRRYFHKGGDEHRTHHVHAYLPDNLEVARHLDFRDYLSAHPDVAAEYAQLKRAVAQRFPQDIYGYMDGKDSFIQDVIRRAQAWRRGEPTE